MGQAVKELATFVYSDAASRELVKPDFAKMGFSEAALLKQMHDLSSLSSGLMVPDSAIRFSGTKGFVVMFRPAGKTFVPAKTLLAMIRDAISFGGTKAPAQVSMFGGNLRIAFNCASVAQTKAAREVSSTPQFKGVQLRLGGE